jgi:hypothetical protein
MSVCPAIRCAISMVAARIHVLGNHRRTEAVTSNSFQGFRIPLAFARFSTSFKTLRRPGVSVQFSRRIYDRALVFSRFLPRARKSGSPDWTPGASVAIPSLPSTIRQIIVGFFTLHPVFPRASAPHRSLAEPGTRSLESPARCWCKERFQKIP